ncbi:hypothetical protein [Nitrospirillum iridis]|uniref:Uncharacterized protein n=1 Tax=Nitrospirillum iridis TaxID=765888 RepID=A0A7X0B1K7_9PROT|nr:hypothetical protein [Nitrospirillum iridis]MBB6254103.1 hypothetical protein [Nitrospirillum iridis]
MSNTTPVHQVRLMPPAPLASFPGRGGTRISAAGAPYVDMDNSDAGTAEANGWVRIGRVGPTANRPVAFLYAGTVMDAPHPGDRYIDTDLGITVYWHPALKAWVDVTGTPV